MTFLLLFCVYSYIYENRKIRKSKENEKKKRRKEERKGKKEKQSIYSPCSLKTSDNNNGVAVKSILCFPNLKWLLMFLWPYLLYSNSYP